jgi:uncharacterized repeat protein (TIGR03803 family)
MRLLFVLLTLTSWDLEVQAQTLSVLHSFTGGPDGGIPYAGLTVDRGGNLYGTTYSGGAGYGVAFKLTHKNGGWVSTSIYTFRGLDFGDGAGPTARVIFGPDGALYGTTVAGGIGTCSSGINRRYPGCGTVFKLTPQPTVCKTALCPWTETVLYRFSGGADGANPFGSVVFDQAGNLYGTSTTAHAAGNVFKLTHAGPLWTETVLYTFTGQPPDGGDTPYSELTFDHASNLYGTTLRGGLYGFGTVFQLVYSGSSWTGSTIYSIPPTTPVWAGVILDQAGNIFGGTYGNPEEGCGILFEVSPMGAGWNGEVLYDFPCTNGYGAGPAASLLMTNGGSLLGTTAADGNGGCDGFGCGTVFEAVHNPDGTWSNVYLYEFTGGADGGIPFSNVTVDSNGNLFGTASQSGLTQTGCGGSGCGVVWELTP